MTLLGFNMNQADSLVRKIIGKKKIDQMEMLRRIMKYGKINSDGPEGWEDNPIFPGTILNINMVTK